MTVRWTLLILNVLAAMAFLGLAVLFTSVHRAHAYSTYRYFVINHAVVESQKSSDGKPGKIEPRMEAIGNVDLYYTIFGVAAAVACLANGFVFFCRRSEATRVT